MLFKSNSQDTLSFFLPMMPPTKTHQEKRVRVVKGKPVLYESTELKDVRAKLEAYLAKHTPAEKFVGPVQLVVKWCFPIKGDHFNGEWKISKPDTDNLDKMLKDVMTALGFWKDDAQVASEIIQKFWATMPGLYISIGVLEQPGRRKG